MIRTGGVNQLAPNGPSQVLWIVGRRRGTVPNHRVAAHSCTYTHIAAADPERRAPAISAAHDATGL
jgi:hypothetical protein